MNGFDQAAAALALAGVVCRAAQPVFQQIARDPTRAFIATLRPRPDDYPKVFIEGATEVARAAYDVLWSRTPDVALPSASQSDIRCVASPAGMLADDNDLSHGFPGAYRRIARYLEPHRVWLCWRYVAPGESSGLAYDGLVWCDDHWAWFPKPWRALGDR